MARLLILGGSNSQLNAILRAKDKGHTVIVADYLENAPGRKYADYSELVSTFDAPGCLAAACKYQIEGILTMGTDQPVLTCAKVAEALGIPFFLDVPTAQAVTHKKIMKGIFTENNILSPEYRIIAEDFAETELAGLRLPLVIKPLDSQGQRGVYQVRTAGQVRDLLPDVLSYSREQEILVEEYYESEEITLSGWIHNDRIHILTITDRRTIANYPHIGICIAHDFPSRYLSSHFKEIEELTAQIVSAFAIKKGPIYIQMLIGAEGVKVNEVACRLGGAYEDELIPAVTGVDILNMLIDYAAGQKVDYTALEKYVLNSTSKPARVQMIFTKPGKVGSMTPMEKIRELPGVLAGRFNYQAGDYISELSNATQRVGYMILRGEFAEDLTQKVRQAYELLEICDSQGNDMLADFPSLAPRLRESLAVKRCNSRITYSKKP